MIQFINKTDLKQIDEYDLQKVEAMEDLLGMSIDNASEHHAVINAKVGVQENFANMSEIIEQTNKLVEEN